MVRRKISRPISIDHRTRQRLIDAAGEVFAERGFRGATVRAICRRAGANVAAVNYHFGDKEKLYVELLRCCGDEAVRKYPADPGLPPAADPRTRLRAFVRSLLFRVAEAGRPAWHGKLMAREMVEPTAALDLLVEQTIRPQQQYLARVIRETVGATVSDAAIRRCVASVVGQCLFYHHSRSIMTRLYPEQRFEPRDLEILADHITEFSLRGLEGLSRPPRKGGRP